MTTEQSLDALVAAAQNVRKTRSLNVLSDLEVIALRLRRQILEDAAKDAHNRWRKSVGLPELTQ